MAHSRFDELMNEFTALHRDLEIMDMTATSQLIDNEQYNLKAARLKEVIAELDQYEWATGRKSSHA